MNKTFALLQNANIAYNIGNLPAAKKYAAEALSLFRSQNVTPGSDCATDCLKALILLQSIASRTHDITAYEAFEPEVRDFMLCSFGNLSRSYYAVHLLDSCQCYLNSGDTSVALQKLENAMLILREENGDCHLISFLHMLHTAKIHFQLHQYHECIDTCLSANSYWLEDVLIPDDAGEFLVAFADNESQIDNYGLSNLILLGSAYGKINNFEDGIAILSELIKSPPEDFYLRASLDLNLAELYTRAGMLAKARPLYSKYRNQHPELYPDLHAALASLSLMLETDSTVGSLPSLSTSHDGELPASTCYSKDAFQILLYNYGLKLIHEKKYTEALTVYHQLGNRGLSLKLFLLAQTGNHRSIPACKEKADYYYDCEIRSLFLYYNEKLVHNHLSLLEYHFSLCMDAYICCHETLSESVLSAQSIYDFLLNTKYISMEASYLSRSFRSLEDLNKRSLFTSDRIMRKLTATDVLLEYCITRTITESYYCVFVITCDRISCIRLAAKDTIDELISEWYSLIQHSVHATVQEAEELNYKMRETDNRLRRLLYRPVKDALPNLPTKRFIISPAGALVHFSFAHLSTSAGTRLGELHEITYVNTAKELITNSFDKPLPCKEKLIIGNPSVSGFPPLPYAEKEALTAAKLLCTTCYTGTNATLSQFEQCTKTAPSLIHIATHGIFLAPVVKEDAPDWNSSFQVMDNSGLLLSGNELLSCNYITTLNLSDTKLVILSACDTGKALPHSAEGVYGLRRSFRLAGCHSMILSLWNVDDVSGCFFIETFYRHLCDDFTNAGEAFSLALKELRNSFPHPYYWAGYIFME